MASTKTPSSKTAGSNGSGRLPSTRERRPALAALAILLIVGGALASAWLAVRAGHRAEYVQVAADVGQGSVIEESDLKTVELPEDFEGGVPEDEMDDLVGQVAATPWTEGMVVMNSMVSSEKEFEAEIVQLPLPVTGLTAELDAGSTVVVYTGGDAPILATVASEPSVSDGATSSGEATATISLPVSCGSEVVQADSEDLAYVGKLPSGSSEDIRTSCNGGG